MLYESSIASVATPPGQGAIAIIRISGPDSIAICSKIFNPADGRKSILTAKPNSILFGTIIDKKTIVDEVLISIFHSPHSYTGEDTVEISCHGSVYIQQTILQLLFSHGAIPAKPGEFTMRAFMNGKMDLSRAEAVADLIASESAAFHNIAMNQMRGGISSEISNLREKLLEFISLIELELDFSEEDVEFADRNKLQSLLNIILTRIENLTSSFAYGNALKSGIPVVIAGKPNVGKSTLLNALLSEEKALVSDVPGTTRDSIEDVIHIDGISFRFIDTAGLRETTDKVEVMGIKRTMEKVRKADIILLMVEASDSPGHVKHLFNEIKQKSGFRGKNIILIINKVDINPALPDSFSLIREEEAGPDANNHIIMISAKQGTGIDDLKNLLLAVTRKGLPAETSVILTNARHHQALVKAAEAVSRASGGLENQLPGDLLAMDIREVLHYLGEITGEITSDEILGNIFSKFCIGK